MLGSVIAAAAAAPQARNENYERQRNARAGGSEGGRYTPPTVFSVPRDYNSAIVRKSRRGTSGGEEGRWRGGGGADERRVIDCN